MAKSASLLRERTVQSVAVIGLGRFGSALALELMSSGAEVLGVDESEEIVQSLNGKLTHEASRVGILEPLHNLLEGEGKNLEKAIRKAYVEIYTREPSKDEIKEGVALLEESESCLDGMADLRWAMLNSHEFKFLP